ncbi:MAG: RIP metalloprotease RseP [Bacteroidales bacterium]|nr:RIP metalloprotease RseP [Bacteroidales bacterium]
MSADFWIKAAQLIVSLSFLIFIHELGHFFWARVFKTRVNKFYLFFNPNFSILRAKKFNGKWHFEWFKKNQPEHLQPLLDANGEEKKDKKGNVILVPAPIDELPDDDWRKYPDSTEWGIGWLPLGGYCSIAGMVDESMDPTVTNTEPQPWEYRSKKTWQRLLIITGGVVNNFIGALIIYSMLMFSNGEEWMPVRNAYLGYDYCTTAQNYGFENGDIIKTINGVEPERISDVAQYIIIEGKQDVTVLRNGQEVNITLPKSFGESYLEIDKDNPFMSPRFPLVIDDFSDNSPAKNIGMEIGDSIVGVNGKAMSAASEIRDTLANHPSDTVVLSFVRNHQTMQMPVELNEDGALGVALKNPALFFKTETKRYGFFASIPAGIKKGFSVLGSYVKQFRLVFTKAGAKSLGGFGAIGGLFPSEWNWTDFWSLTAFLSVILAFMNILPIPVLDGGYVLFILYEMITRRKPSEKVMEIMLNIGMFLLLALLIFANGNDLIKWILKLIGK